MYVLDVSCLFGMVFGVVLFCVLNVGFVVWVWCFRFVGCSGLVVFGVLGLLVGLLGLLFWFGWGGLLYGLSFV